MTSTEKYIVGGIAIALVGGVVYLSFMNKKMRNENTQRTVDAIRRDMTDQSQVPEGIRTQTAESLTNAASGRYATRNRSQAQAYAEANGLPYDPLFDPTSGGTNFERHV